MVYCISFSTIVIWQYYSTHPYCLVSCIQTVPSCGSTLHTYSCLYWSWATCRMLLYCTSVQVQFHLTSCHSHWWKYMYLHFRHRHWSRVRRLLWVRVACSHPCWSRWCCCWTNARTTVGKYLRRNWSRSWAPSPCPRTWTTWHSLTRELRFVHRWAVCLSSADVVCFSHSWWMWSSFTEWLSPFCDTCSCSDLSCARRFRCPESVFSVRFWYNPSPPPHFSRTFWY